jgi:type IV secretory pathway VirB2 component (pilin)
MCAAVVSLAALISVAVVSPAAADEQAAEQMFKAMTDYPGKML